MSALADASADPRSASADPRSASSYMWVDHYRPGSFTEFKTDDRSVNMLDTLAKVSDIPHMIIKGMSGSGRNTLAELYIQAKYHRTSLPKRQQILEIKHGSKSIELPLIHSNYHYYIDPSEHGVYDRIIVQDFIKDVLQTKPISGSPYHIVIIGNANRLTVEAQQSLRRTLEKNVANCRFIFIIDQEATLIEPLMSRCIHIRLATPTYEQITEILANICKSEKIRYQPDRLTNLAHISDRNLNTAINLLQYMSLYQPEALDNELEFAPSDREKLMIGIVGDVMSKKTPKTILGVRSVLFDLLVHCEDPLMIMKRLFELFMNEFERRKLSESYYLKLVELFVKYENTLKLGSKPIYHLEGFICGIINLF